ncbi:MAG: hypothetical protein KJS73_05985 [Gammaproteobacteria bacterium]|jgi:hypothetical protein|nr:hypothetical protein [Gammaproteobacteria bacterium]
MRVTDDRYRRDRSRLELALRLVKHEARTQTIRQWTGLSDDRVRKLIRSYIRPGAAIRRHRGKSPQQVGFFLRSAQLDHDTHVLAAMLVLFGVLPTRQRGSAPRRAAPIQQGRLLCDAFDAYTRVVENARIDFERAAFLADALSMGDEIRLQWCEHCGGVNVIEALRLREVECRACSEMLPPQRPGRAVRATTRPPATLGHRTGL